MSWLQTPSSAAKPQATQTALLSGVPIQTSVLGQAITIVFGTTRVGANLIWYGGFKKKKHTQANPSQSGKGGIVGGSSGKGQQGDGTVSYTYSASFAFGLCEGPIQNVLSVYMDKSVSSLSSLNMIQKDGSYGQSPWSYLTANFPGKDLAYSGLCYVGAANFDLTTTPQVPTLSYEVKGFGPFNADGDTNPADVIIGLLTGNGYGLGFPSARLASLSNYRTYTQAANLYVSPAYQDQRPASQLLQDLATLTNSAFIWTGGVLEVVPLGDESLTANGSTYNPPSAPLFDLTDDDFQETGEDGPVQVIRTQPSDACNAVTVEFLNRNRRYAPDTAEAKDQARIDAYGLIPAPTVSAHVFCKGLYARKSAQYQLQRYAVRNRYKFRLDQRYMLLDPMDIVTITDSSLGLSRQWVRILEMTETSGGFDFLAEEYLNGNGTAAEYNFSESDGFIVDYNAAPDPANAPYFIEPTDELAGGLEVLVAVSSSGANWGGADVWVSINGSDYSIAGRVKDGARMGTLTAILSTVAEAFADTTLDTFNVLSVDISQSGTDAALVSVSSDDANALTTACFVDGEYIAFSTATLTGTGKYDLSFLVRGAFGTSPAAHAVGSKFCRMDSSLLAVPYTQSQVGQSFKVKITSLNVYGGGEESLASVPEYEYTIVGSALASPLPNVTNLRTVFVDNVIYLDWTEISDFRSVLYEVRKGPSWLSAQSIGRFAHPTAATQGSAMYWVAAVTIQGGLTVYSETPVSIDLTGTATVVALLNVVKTWDEGATLFSGALAGNVVLQGGGASVSTTSAGDITADADITDDSDISNYGGQGSGIYEVPVGHQIDVGYVTAAKITVNWTSGGANIIDNVLTLADYLNDPDILSSSDSQLVEVYPEIAVSQGTAPLTTLLHFDGADTSTTITDTMGVLPWTANGDAQLDTAIFQFGTAALLCDGTGDYVTTPDHASLTLGSSDFTIDLWFNRAGGDGTRRHMAGSNNATAGAGSWSLELTSANQLDFRVVQGTTFINQRGTTTITTTGWHHAALVRDGDTLRLFLDGVQESTAAISGAVNDSALPLSVGRRGDQATENWNGSIDEFRMSVGAPRWTTNFTPPIAADITLAFDTWGPWVRFSGAGEYQGKKFKIRMQITTLQTDIIASLLSLTFTVQVPVRVDHFVNQALSSGGTAITFRPDGAANAPFNFGPGAVATPYVQASVRGGAARDTVIISSVSTSGATFQVIDSAGAGKAGNVDIQVVGY